MTAPRATLPEPPKVELEIVRESRVGEGGFLAIRRMELRAVLEGARSASFTYDGVDRHALHASVMVAYHRAEGSVWVWLRSCLRPPAALRAPRVANPAVLWEVPAGLIEPGETASGAAARELAEELGFHVEEAALVRLGPPGFPAPAVMGEEHHFFRVEVDPTTRQEPAGDGSQVEASARVIAVRLEDALAAARRGELPDEKTELALRRLADVVNGP